MGKSELYVLSFLTWAQVWWMLNFTSLPFILRGGKKNSCIHSTESWVGLTAGLEVLEKKIVFCAYRNSKPDLIIPNAIKSILLFYSNGFVPLFLAVTLFTFRKGLFTGCNFKIPYRHTCNLWLTKSILCLRYRKATVFLCTKCCIPSSNISLTIFMKPQV